jgi:4-alpha-glucanotransferase
MVPLQDLLDLGAEARMNLPGSVEGNWRWRCTDEILSTAGLDRLRGLITSAKRHL